MVSWVACQSCRMAGPNATSVVSASRLWNILPREADFNEHEPVHVEPPLHPAPRFTRTPNRREHFAVLAMQALLAGREAYSEACEFPDGLADDAVRVADAMIAALDEEKEKCDD
jgi:hypothetical protein